MPWFAAGAVFPVAIVLLLMSRADEGVTEAASNRPSANVQIAMPAPMETTVSANFDGDAEETVVAAAASPAPVAEAVASFHPPLALGPAYRKIELTISKGDTLDRLFRNNGLSIGDLTMIVRLDAAAPFLKKLMPGDKLVIEHDQGRLMSLYRQVDLTSAMLIEKSDDGFQARFIDRPIEVRRLQAYGRIENSLFESAAQAGLNDRVIMNVAGIFAWDVDFVLDIRRGDDYYVLYEQIFQDGKFVRDGEIVAAEFNNNGRTIQAIRYIDDNGRSDYFTPDGRSVRKAFVRAPVDFTRISSSFNPQRRHPILNTIRAHKGVDYAAPKGTAIKAAGDGKIIFRGTKGGYGRTVIIQHGGNITTLYAHMNAFDKNTSIGGRVVQGQTIGYVGMTGLATAPHLHYEYRLNGVHRNPRTVDLPQADPIAEKYKNEFLASVDPILSELLQSKPTNVAALADD